jgi:hypothetical protein
VAFTAPVPRPPHRFLAMWEPLDDDLSSPWVLRRSSPVTSGEADSRRTFRPTRLPTVSPADPRSELGHCSLDPDRTFWCAFAELIRGQTSPTDFCNCTYDVRATKPGLFLILAGTETSISFLFLSQATPSPLRKRWPAASRATSGDEGPSAGSSRLREFAQP